MPRQLSIFLSTLLIFGMIQLGCQVRAQSPKTITNSIGMKLVLIPKGTFDMGSAATDRGADLDEPQHQVTLSRDFYIGQFEVTQSQYEEVMGINPNQFPRDKRIDPFNYPVALSWTDAAKFCKQLSGLPEEKKAGRIYRLPTEAEWEYACRAGTSTAFHGCSAFPDGTNDDALAVAIAWTSANSNNQTQPVGQKLPNGFGLYDMQGNVFEWINDFYNASYYAVSPSVDPLGPSSGGSYVTRGGVFLADSGYARCSNRTNSISGNTAYTIGFRVARNP